jgi:hypothetical protein
MSRATVRVVAYLVAQPLHVALCQLLALHQALNPAVQGGDCCGLRRGGRRELHRLGHLHVLHVGVHGGGAAGLVMGRWGSFVVEVELSRGSCPFKLGR